MCVSIEREKSVYKERVCVERDRDRERDREREKDRETVCKL